MKRAIKALDTVIRRLLQVAHNSFTRNFMIPSDTLARKILKLESGINECNGDLKRFKFCIS